jgi:phospholipid/cholesterol/gamma-HCH transport system substrate-binding protein
MRGVSVATLVKVVAFAVGSVVLTIALGMRIANVGFFGDTQEMQAVFDNASGVFEGDAVKLAGVDVGRVTGTRIENGKAVVTFDIDSDVRLTTESHVGIRWRNVIGLRFLYVYPGDGGTALAEGARIPTSRTDEAGDIGEFLNNLGPILRAIDPEEANAFLDAVNTALSGNEATVQALLTDGAVLAGELGDMDQDIGTLLDSSDRIMAAYASQDDALGSIIDDLELIARELAGSTSEINLLVDNFSVVQEQLTEILQENRTNIDEGIRSLDSVARTVATHRRELDHTLCTLPAGVVSYDQTSSWGEWFNVRIYEFTVKDEHGKVIAGGVEGPDGRTDQAAAPAHDCGGPGEGGRNVVPSQSAPALPALPAPPSGSLGTWIDTVVGGPA